jgi:opacity protein-like surface antigen
MRILGLAIVGSLLATPAFAQRDRLYVEGTGGFAVSSASTLSNTFTSGSSSAQVGAHVGNHVSIFGELGHFRDLAPANVQTNVDATVTSLAADQGLEVTGTTSMPATFGLGGARVTMPVKWSHVTPYVLGGLGGAHIDPSAEFHYTAGTLPGTDPSATTPAIGDDVTANIISSGLFTQPASSTAFMFSLGGGANINISRHWLADAGYRYSRIDATTPLNQQGMQFGVGYRF